MSKDYSAYVPETVGELMDHLASMMLESPRFKDTAGHFPEQNIDTEFFALNEGLRKLQNRLGEKRYQHLKTLSDQMRRHFEADPEDKTEDAIKGREIILEMRELLRKSGRK